MLALLCLARHIEGQGFPPDSGWTGENPQGQPSASVSKSSNHDDWKRCDHGRSGADVNSFLLTDVNSNKRSTQTGARKRIFWSTKDSMWNEQGCQKPTSNRYIKTTHGITFSCAHLIFCYRCELAQPRQ